MSTDDQVADAHELAAAPEPRRRRWRPWWVVGTPGQLVWTCLMACLWMSIAISTVATRHRPGDYWYLALVAGMWIVLIVNVVAYVVRRDLLLLPPRPKSGPGRAAFIAGAALCTAGAVVPVFLIGSRPALAVLIAAICVAVGTLLVIASRRLGPDGVRQDAAPESSTQSG